MHASNTGHRNLLWNDHVCTVPECEPQNYEQMSSQSMIHFSCPGPGCTSMDGFLNEHGPFQLQFTESGALVASLREHAWTTVS